MSEWKKVKLGDICEITAGGDKPQVVSNCMVLNTNKRAVIHCPFICALCLSYNSDTARLYFEV